MEVLKLEVYNSRWTPLHSNPDQIKAHSVPSLRSFLSTEAKAAIREF